MCLSKDLLKMSFCLFESKLHLTIGKVRFKSLKEGFLDNRFMFLELHFLKHQVIETGLGHAHLIRPISLTLP